jgi:hypothetical protein
MPKIWFTILIINLNINLFGQQYISSNKPQLNQKKSIYHQPIGESSYGNYMLNYATEFLTGGFSIERYDQNLNFIDDRFIDVPRNNYIIKIFISDSGIYYVSLIKRKKEGIGIYLNRISYNLSELVESKLIDYIDRIDINSDEIISDYNVLARKFCICYMKKIDSESSEVFIKSYNIEGEKLLFQRAKILQPIQNIYWNDVSVSNSGYTLALLNVSKSKESFIRKAKNKSYIFFKIDVNGIFTKEIESIYLLQNIHLALDPEQRFWILAGLFGENKVQSLGLFELKIPVNNADSGSKIDYFFTQSQSKILEGSTLKTENSKLFPENYTIRNIIFMANGNYMVCLERFNELKQLETFYINGIPQTATKILYNYNEIGLVFISPQGIDTCLIINKEQIAAPNTSYMLGYSTFTCEKAIHVLYNGDISKDNQIIDVIIKPDYTMQKRILIDSENFYCALVPFDGRETNYCSFTVPLIRDKQWFWIKISDND